MKKQRQRLPSNVRREQILESARTMFISRGFEATTMADIAGQLEMSRPNIYGYFPDTLSILDVLIERAEQQMIEVLQPIYQEKTTSKNANFLKEILRQTDILKLLAAGSSPEFRQRRNKFHTHVEKQVLPEELHTTLTLDPTLLQIVRQIVIHFPENTEAQSSASPEHLSEMLRTFLAGGIQKVIETQHNE